MLGFIAAVVAGVLTPYLQDPLARPLAEALSPRIVLEPGEVRLLAFMIAMLIAGIVANLLHSGSTFWVILGGVLGYFGPRLVAAAKDGMNGRSS
jgi:hypothetical protein